MSWLIESYLKEAETATKERSPIRTDGAHNGEIKNYTVIKGKPGDKNEKRVLKDIISRNDAKSYKLGNHISIDADGKETKYDKSKDDKDYNNAKKYANKQLKPGMFKKADKEKVAQAADAIARHDRRHPDRKVVNASADIIEILQ